MQEVKISLVLHNIRSIYNVGAILRTSEGLGVDEVIYSGYTPRYHDPAALPHLRAKLDRQIAKAALGAEQMVSQEIVEDLPAWLEKRRGESWALIGLENNLSPDEAGKRILLDEIGKRALAGRPAPAPSNQSDSRQQPIPGPCPLSKIVLVLGEEVAGIPADIRTKLDYFLEIPMVGRKESFNVSVAAGIALWGLKHR